MDYRLISSILNFRSTAFLSKFKTFLMEDSKILT